MRLLAVAMVALVLAGCASEEDLTISNKPPETYLAIADTVRHQTTYSQELRWWGDDTDGEVIAYEYRWFIDPRETGCSLDSNWTRTEETSKVFDLPVTNGESIHRFEVRAIDNLEMPDPTPSELTLPVTNSPPSLEIWNSASLPDTTLAAFQVKWHGTDPEGDSTIAEYMAWLDGNRENAKIVTPPDTMVSLGRDDFSGRFNSTRTLNIIAIDSGCDTSEVVTHSWYVKEPTGDILLVDDLGQEGAALEAQSDQFYRSGLKTCGEFSVLDLDKYRGIISAHNFPALFAQYDVVIWYNEPRRDASTRLPLVENDLKSYVEGGGGLLLASMAALGSGGALRDSLWPDIFGVDSLFVKGKPPTHNFDCTNWAIKGNADAGLDTLKAVGLWPGVECLHPYDYVTVTPLYYIPPGTTAGTTTPKNTEDYYLGLLNTWQTGKAAYISFPLSRGDGYGNARSEYCKVVNLLLQ